MAVFRIGSKEAQNIILSIHNLLGIFASILISYNPIQEQKEKTLKINLTILFKTNFIKEKILVIWRRKLFDYKSSNTFLSFDHISTFCR